MLCVLVIMFYCSVSIAVFLLQCFYCSVSIAVFLFERKRKKTNNDLDLVNGNKIIIIVNVGFYIFDISYIMLVYS